MLSLVIILHGGGGKNIPCLSNGHSVNDANNNKPFIAMSTHPTNVYIMEKSKKVPILEVTEEIVSNLLSYYESKAVICQVNGF